MSSGKLGMKAGRPSAAKAGPTLSDLADKQATVRVNFDLDRAEHTKLKIYAPRPGAASRTFCANWCAHLMKRVIE